VLEYLPLVRAIAVRVYENLPVHVELDDLVHAGVLGLFDAAMKFDQEKKVTFKGYAKHRIKGAILDSLREMDWASRDMRKRHKKLEEITRELASTMERPPTEEEIAGKMGMDVERWRQVAIELQMVGLVSASRAPDDENQTVPEFPATNDLNPDVLTCRRELQAVLQSAIADLPPRYQAVIQHYYAGIRRCARSGRNWRSMRAGSRRFTERRSSGCSRVCRRQAFTPRRPCSDVG